jgi:hypothetical protein
MGRPSDIRCRSPSELAGKRLDLLHELLPTATDAALRNASWSASIGGNEMTDPAPSSPGAPRQFRWLPPQDRPGARARRRDPRPGGVNRAGLLEDG